MADSKKRNRMSNKKNSGKNSSSKKKGRQEEKVERKPIVERYDGEGNRIGDDGLEMTASRTRLHKLLNFCFVWAIVLGIIAIILIVLSYFQGAQYQDWELVARGGNQFNGWDTATLLRVESVFLLVMAVLYVVLNFRGFGWMYDKRRESGLKVPATIILVASAAFLVAAILLAGIPEPGSIINIIVCAMILSTMKKVRREMPHLKKPKVAKTVEKK
ncbi:MAG: hypothetical protein ACOX1O_04095 [Eggerthellaceae bacterium]